MKIIFNCVVIIGLKENISDLVWGLAECEKSLKKTSVRKS